MALTAFAPNGFSKWALIVPSYRSQVRLFGAHSFIEVDYDEDRDLVQVQVAQ